MMLITILHYCQTPLSSFSEKHFLDASQREIDVFLSRLVLGCQQRNRRVIEDARAQQKGVIQ